MKLYLAIGHGIEPDGTYDPGATFGGLVEHDLAVTVVEATVAALHRSGFTDFAHETSTPGRTDGDYRTTVTRANAANAAYVIEVHFNASGTSGEGHGSLVCAYTDQGKTGELAQRTATALAAAVGLGDGGVQVRHDLWLLRGCHGHAIIPEVAFVDGDHDKLKADPELLLRAGEAIAAAFLATIGHPYTAPDGCRWLVHTGAGSLVGSYPNRADVLAEVKHLLATDVDRVTITRHCH